MSSCLIAKKQKLPMKKHLALFAFTLLAHQATALDLIPNLVPNGDFELENQASLAGWLPFDTVPDKVPNNVHGVPSGYFEFIWDTGSDGGGNGSLLLRGKGNRPPVPPGVSPLVARSETVAYIVSPKIPVKENTEYKLSYSIKTNGMADPATKQPARVAFEIRFYTGNGKPGYAGHNGRVPNLSAKENDKQLSAIDTATHAEDIAVWQRCEANIRTPQATTDLVLRVRAMCTKPGQKFSAWIDNIKLTPTSGETSATKTREAWHPRTLPPSTTRGLATGDLELLPPPIPYGSRIQRTMKLLATSTPEHRNKVRILCYGQSIMAQAWWRVVQADLRQRFPNADLEMVNLSLGGFMSNDLIHSAETDMIPFYPDLVLLHDYMRNGPEELEALYGGLHHRTTSEMLTLTHHVAFPGIFAFNAHKHDAESVLINETANRHGFEVAQIRDNWKHLLALLHPDTEQRVAAQNYLQDQVHLGKRGEQLMQQITTRHFEFRSDQKPSWLEKIRVYLPDGTRWPQTGDEYPWLGSPLTKSLKFEYEGNRIDLIAAPVAGVPGSAKILIDGQAPSTIPGLCVATRTSLAEGSPWPYIKHVQTGGQPLPQEWTLTYTKVTPRHQSDGKPANFEIEFDLVGSITGPDGSGSTRERFVSKSGLITIDPAWFLPAGFWPSIKSQRPIVGTAVKWKTITKGVDQWKAKPGLNPATEDHVVLAQGLSNSKHVLEIIPDNDGALALRCLIVHQPGRQ